MFVGHKIIFMVARKKNNKQIKQSRTLCAILYDYLFATIYIAIKFDGACDISKFSIQVARVKEVNYNENGA